jgi:hypothetical protein
MNRQRSATQQRRRDRRRGSSPRLVGIGRDDELLGRIERGEVAVEPVIAGGVEVRGRLGRRPVRDADDELKPRLDRRQRIPLALRYHHRRLPGADLGIVQAIRVPQGQRRAVASIRWSFSAGQPVLVVQRLPGLAVGDSQPVAVPVVVAVQAQLLGQLGIEPTRFDPFAVPGVNRHRGVRL